MIVKDMYMSGKPGRNEAVTTAFEKLSTAPWRGFVVYASRNAIYTDDLSPPLDLLEWFGAECPNVLARAH